MVFLGLASRVLVGVICGIVLNTCNPQVVNVDFSSVVEVYSGDVSGDISGDIETLEDSAIIETEEEIVEEEAFVFNKPLVRGKVTSRYGMRNGRMHSGIDIADKTNTEIYAAQSGKVIFAGYSGNYGNLIKIQHDNGYQTYYAHCNKILVSIGEYVEKNQLIGLVGSTGNATGPHLHFEIREDGNVVNPYSYIY